MTKLRGARMTSGSGPLYGPQWTEKLAMSCSRSEPTIMKIGTRESPSDTSELISWAAARRPPRSEYLELDDQPPSRSAYAFIELTAKIRRTPMFRLAIQYEKPCQIPNGITAQARNAAVTMMAGAIT